MRSLVRAIFHSSLKKRKMNKGMKRLTGAHGMTHYESVTNMVTTVE